MEPIGILRTRMKYFIANENESKSTENYNKYSDTLRWVGHIFMAPRIACMYFYLYDIILLL